MSTLAYISIAIWLVEHTVLILYYEYKIKKLTEEME